LPPVAGDAILAASLVIDLEHRGFLWLAHRARPAAMRCRFIICIAAAGIWNLTAACAAAAPGLTAANLKARSGGAAKMFLGTRAAKEALPALREGADPL
jgi:hypothetical protein